FRTIAYTTGRIDESRQVLYGDLVIEAEGDPHFTLESAEILAASIRSQGIKRVEGRLIFRGPFRFFRRWSTEYAQTRMRAALGLTFPKLSKDSVDVENKGVVESEERVLLGVHSSKPLRELLLYMNAHSDNFYADQLGEALGGPSVVQQELQAEFKLQPYELQISHTSGLDYNRITPRASLAIQRKMIQLLAKHHMKIEEIVPVAGVDSGTLATRFRSEDMRGAIVGKTGTLNVTDNGVSALQGVIYTRRFGPVMYALFNMGGGVHYFRKLQDEFLKEALAELGTELTPIRTENIFGEVSVETPKFKVKKVSRRYRR
ncbi:MAG: D-alanyl-D-alanine carboxypeptidase, partial [Nitrososphaerota archaeon]